MKERGDHSIVKRIGAAAATISMVAQPSSEPEKIKPAKTAGARVFT